MLYSYDTISFNQLNQFDGQKKTPTPDENGRLGSAKVAFTKSSVGKFDVLTEKQALIGKDNFSTILAKVGVAKGR